MTRGCKWSIFEVRATVDDYFCMLRAELSGQRYNKSAHRRELVKQLDGRTEGSVERKHGNISAVLLKLGMIPINGYKPYQNYQKDIETVVYEYLRDNSEILELFLKSTRYTPSSPKTENIRNPWVKPPVLETNSNNYFAERKPVYFPSSRNYFKLEVENSLLGERGESFVIEIEKARLIKVGKEYLAKKIEQVSETRGPSAGYDIHSYEDDGTDRFIEAKTTKYGISAPFFVTSNEVSFSERNKSRYFLYRVFQFGNAPKLFKLSGSLTEVCTLQPTVYQAKLF